MSNPHNPAGTAPANANGTALLPAECVYCGAAPCTGTAPECAPPVQAVRRRLELRAAQRAVRTGTGSDLDVAELLPQVPAEQRAFRGPTDLELVAEWALARLEDGGALDPHTPREQHQAALAAVGVLEAYLKASPNGDGETRETHIWG